jgi:hypothetical protein
VGRFPSMNPGFAFGSSPFRLLNASIASRSFFQLGETV